MKKERIIEKTKAETIEEYYCDICEKKTSKKKSYGTDIGLRNCQHCKKEICNECIGHKLASIRIGGNEHVGYIVELPQHLTYCIPICKECIKLPEVEKLTEKYENLMKEMYSLIQRMRLHPYIGE